MKDARPRGGPTFKERYTTFDIYSRTTAQISAIAAPEPENNSYVNLHRSTNRLVFLVKVPTVRLADVQKGARSLVVKT